MDLELKMPCQNRLNVIWECAVNRNMIFVRLRQGLFKSDYITRYGYWHTSRSIKNKQLKVGVVQVSDTSGEVS